MAAYSSTLYTSQNAGRASEPTHGIAGNVKAIQATVATDTSMAANDTLNFFYLPAGARIISATLRSTDIDSNGSPTVTFNVGDTGSATRIFSASVVGQAGTTDGNFASGAWGYQYTTRTLVFGTVQAAAATKVAGSVNLHILYTVDGMAD